ETELEVATGGACACDTTPAACDKSCACDLECEFDWDTDAAAAAELEVVPDLDDEALERIEIGDAEKADGPTARYAPDDIELDVPAGAEVPPPGLEADDEPAPADDGELPA